MRIARQDGKNIWNRLIRIRIMITKYQIKSNRYVRGGMRIARQKRNNIRNRLTRICITITTQWRRHGRGGLGVTTSPIEPQMTSYIIETVPTKCIIGEAFKVSG